MPSKKKFFSHPSSFVDKGAVVGAGTRIWHFCHLMPNCSVGKNCNLGQSVFVGRGVTIGNNVKIQNNVSVYSGVTLENDVFVGPSATFTNVKNPRSPIVIEESKYATTLVKQSASIGANATIVCGLTIGKFAFIGAGSVVTRDVADYSLVYGNPAKPHGFVCKCGHRLNTSTTPIICSNCSTTFTLRNNCLSPSK